MSVQSANSNILSDVPAISADTSITALDIVNLNSVIDEALSYDTTLNDINQAIVAGGQITIDKNDSGQILNGTTAQQITPENLPDLEITVPSSVLYTQVDDRYNSKDKKERKDCAIIDYKICEKAPGGQYATLAECPGCGDTNAQICKSLSNVLTDDGVPLGPNSWPPLNTTTYGVNIGTSPTHQITNTDNDNKKSRCGCKVLCQGPMGVLLMDGCIPIEGCKDTYSPGAFPINIGPYDRNAKTPDGKKSLQTPQQNNWIDNLSAADKNIYVVTGQAPTGGRGTLNSAISNALDNLKNTCGCDIWRTWSVTERKDANKKCNVTLKVICPAKYYKKRIECDGQIEALEPTETLSELPTFNPIYDCTCKSLNSNDTSEKTGELDISKPNSGLLLIGSGPPPISCTYYVSRWCGTAYTHCDCKITNKNDAPVGTSLQPYSFDTPQTGKIDYNIQYPDLASCYNPIGCPEIKCDGLDCCNSPTPRTIWDKASPSSQNVKCNTHDTIYGQDIGICNIDSESEYPIYKYTISQRFRKCDEKADNKNTFDSLSDAEATITDPAVIKYNKLKNDWDKQTTLKNQMPKLQTLSTYTKDSQTYGSRNLDKRCSSCQVVYLVTISTGNYPCRDTTSNSSVNCGLYNQCNVDSDDTSVIKIATITKVEPTTVEIIAKAKSGMDQYYDDLGKAIAYAKSVANPGIVLSSPCPD